jgi:hypothetical protein
MRDILSLQLGKAHENQAANMCSLRSTGKLEKIAAQPFHFPIFPKFQPE